MLDTIISWLLSALGEGLEWVCEWFFTLLDLSLSTMLSYIPFLGTAYSILQACGIGITLGLAAWGMFKFFAGGISQAQDSPLELLIRAAFAVALIFIGNHLSVFSVSY